MMKTQALGRRTPRAQHRFKEDLLNALANAALDKKLLDKRLVNAVSKE
jgi:hypothetical protein